MDPGTTNINASSGEPTYSQKLGEDFAKFYGLLRIYELYEIVAFIGDSPSFHVIGERHDNEYCQHCSKQTANKIISRLI